MLSRLKRIREKSGVSQNQAAEDIGIPIGTYRNWEQCRNVPHDHETLGLIAGHFGVGIADLIDEPLLVTIPVDLPDGEDVGFIYPSRKTVIHPTSAIRTRTDDPNYIDVPLYGSIAAGTPIEMLPIEDHFPVPKQVAEKYPDGFLLKVKGESMNKRLPNLSYAFINPTQDALDGKAHAICVNGHEATIKRVHVLDNGFELQPDSTDPTFKPQVFDYGEAGTDVITVIGEVVYYVIPFDFEI